MNEDKNTLLISSSPHLKNWEKSRTIMIDVIIALIPSLIWGIYVFGFRSLTISIVSIASCVLFEFLAEKILKKPITILDFSAVVTGLLIAFNLPVSVPLWAPVMGSFFAIVVVKQLFGGIGKNVVNPALAARIFLFIAWPSHFNDYILPHSNAFSAFSINVKVPTDAIASATPLASLKTGVAPETSLFDMVIGNMSGTIGEISVILLVLGGIYLLVRKVISWRIPVAYIATVAILTYIFPSVKSVQAWQFMCMELCSGGLMLGAIFMATDYATSPITDTGKLIYGCGCGLITVFIRYFGGYNEGASFAIMIMNLLVWYIDSFTKPRVFGTAKKKEKAAKEAK